jgi:protein involved in polysaccharide export with SLBB domain
MSQRKIFSLLFPLMLASCSALPGMENIDANTPYARSAYQPIHVDPVIIPITATSLIHQRSAPYIYRIGAQDIISFTVWDHPELNEAAQQNPLNTTQSAGAPGYLVDHQGNIYLPLAGSIHVAGLSTDQVRTLVSKKLSRYLQHPQVILRVTDYRSKKIYVMGEVLKPGFLPMNDHPLSITEALNMSGSIDPNAADPRHIYVIRGDILHPKIHWLNVSSPTALLLGEQFELQPNVVVIVSTAAVTRWNRFLNQLLPTLQTVWYTKAITGK